MSDDLEVKSVWTPTITGANTFSRQIVGLEKSAKARAYDTVRFCRVLSGGSLGMIQWSYVKQFRAWQKKFKAVREDMKTAPPFDAGCRPVSFFAVDHAGQWHYVNHTETWQSCPPPFPQGDLK